MTKQERLERRQANKAKRQERKAIRKERFRELMIKVKETPGFPEDGSTPDYVENFKTYWPLVRSALEFVECSRITRPKMDLKIREIIDLGDRLAGDPDFDPESDFIIKLQKAWRVIRTILIAVTVFITNSKDDEKIDKLIEIGDWVSGIEGNE
jgi:hypothetical protein